jgi:hypothetical protein
VPGWDYLCFTDETSTAKIGWEVRALPQNELDQIRRSRLPKILAHRFLSDYDIRIWIDGNVGIRGDLAEFCKVALAHADIAFFVTVNIVLLSRRNSCLLRERQRTPRCHDVSV